MLLERRCNSKWKNLYFLRHGESTCNEVNRFAGAIDAPLTSLGKAQAQQAARQWQGCPPDIVFTSPLARAHHTASIVFPNTSGDHSPQYKFVVDERITERNFGNFTLKNKAMLQRKIGLKHYEYALYTDSPRMRGGESFTDFYDRVLSFLRDEIHPALKQGKKILVVAHKYVIELLSRLILRISTDDGYDLRLPNARIIAGIELGSYVRNESRRLNLIQEWIVLHHAFVLLGGVITGIFLRSLNMLTFVPPFMPLFILALATGVSLARVDVTSLHTLVSPQGSLKLLIYRYLFLPILLCGFAVLWEGNSFVFFPAILLAAPSAITGITVSRSMGGLVLPTVRTILISTALSTAVTLPLLSANGVTGLMTPFFWLLLISGIGLGLPMLVVTYLRRHHPIETANFAERNGATSILLLVLFIIFSFQNIELDTCWPAAPLGFGFAIILRLFSLLMIRKNSLYAVDHYIAMSYPNIFFVVILTSAMGLENLSDMATWYLLPMFALAPLDEWICKKVLVYMKETRLLEFLRIEGCHNFQGAYKPGLVKGYK